MGLNLAGGACEAHHPTRIRQALTSDSAPDPISVRDRLSSQLQQVRAPDPAAITHRISARTITRISLELFSAPWAQLDVLLCCDSIASGATCGTCLVLLEEPRAVGMAFVSPNEGIDATTIAGKLQLPVLAALAEFERERIRERVHAGLARARGGNAARPRKVPSTIAVPAARCARRHSHGARRSPLLRDGLLLAGPRYSGCRRCLDKHNATPRSDSRGATRLSERMVRFQCGYSSYMRSPSTAEPASKDQ